MGDKKKSTPEAKQANKAAASGDAKRARTEARKEKNRLANEARYRANLEKAQMRGLEPIKVPVTKVKTIKKGKKIIKRVETTPRTLSPAELLRRDDRLRRQREREAREALEQEAQDSLLNDIEQRLLTADLEVL